MKKVKCKSGLTGWQCKLQENYSSYEDFKGACETWGIHSRLGFKSKKRIWELNPTIQGSVEPSDLSVVMFHAIKTKKGYRIKESTAYFGFQVKNSEIGCMDKKNTQKYIDEQLGYSVG